MNVELDPRIAVSLTMNDQRLVFDPETGLITGATVPGNQITVSATVADAALIGIAVKGHDVARLRPNPVAGGTRYDQAIRLSLTGKGLRTEYGWNRLRLLELAGTTIKLYQYAIVVHRNKPYLFGGVQRTIPMYSYSGYVWLPCEPAWTQLEDFVTKLVDVSTLPPQSSFVEPPAADTSRLAATEALVLWYDPAINIGAAELADGTVACVPGGSFNADRAQPVRLFAGDVITFGSCRPNPRTESGLKFVLGNVRTTQPAALVG